MLLKLNDSSFNNKNPTQSFYMMFGEIDAAIAKECCEWIFQANFNIEDKPQVLNLVINSPGGDITAANAIIDVMRGSHIPIRTIGLGQIASAGLMIFIAGEKGMRTITENTSIMSHVYSWGSSGKNHELIAAVKEFDLTTKRMISHYKKCTGLTEKEIIKHLLPKEDVYLCADDAIKFGICDCVTNLK
jgi:ATP-dependent Clp protease protease subunit